MYFKRRNFFTRVSPFHFGRFSLIIERIIHLIKQLVFYFYIQLIYPVYLH